MAISDRAAVELKQDLNESSFCASILREPMDVVSGQSLNCANGRLDSLSTSANVKRMQSIVVLILFTIAGLFARRPDQFMHPYIWVEDGYYNLKTFAEKGIYVLIEPIAGYELFASKLLSYIAFRISVPYSPEIEIVLITAMTCGIMLAIALSPTHLPHPFLCAAGALLVPQAPEVFAVSAYASWWAGLLLFLVPLWRWECQRLRWFYILFGGMSSPTIFPILVIQTLRALLDRNRLEWLSAALCAIVAGVQGFLLWKMSGTAGSPLIETATVLPDTIRYVGSFFVGNQVGQDYYFQSGIIAILVLSALGWLARDRLDRYFGMLVAMFFAACIASLMRQRISWVHPFTAGPRYFFYPFVLSIWIGIWIAAKSSMAGRILLATTYVLTIMFAAPKMTWRHDPLDWRAQLVACADTDAYDLPILWWNGDARDVHWRKFLGEECQAFLSQSLF